MNCRAESIVHRRAGSSLVEVLVVVGLIAILIALLVPTLIRARVAGLRAACGANLHGVAIALSAYADDNRDQLPASYVYPVGPEPSARPGVWLRPYLAPAHGGLALLVHWPAGYAELPGLAGRTYLASAGVLVCPGEPLVEGLTRLSDGLLWSSEADALRFGTLGIGSYFYGYVPAATDAAFAGFERHALSHTADLGRRSILVEHTLLDGPGLGLPKFPLAWFHGPGGNVLYLDGHVDWVSADVVRPFAAAAGGRGIEPRWRATVTAVDR